MEKRKSEWWQITLFIVLTVCLMLMWSLRKEGWFLDEVYSYGLSNSADGPFITDLHGDWVDGTVFEHEELMNYVSVAENDMQRSIIIRRRMCIRRCITFFYIRCVHYSRAALPSGRASA